MLNRHTMACVARASPSKCWFVVVILFHIVALSLVLKAHSVVSTNPSTLFTTTRMQNSVNTTNILFIIVDNLRPALGCYGNTEVITPNIDFIANRSVLFSRAFCQFAWCAPSRNSFLVGRRPDQTKALNFVDSFRNTSAGEQWVTLPGYFKQHGYYTTSVGKVFHPGLPPNFDGSRSWSDQAILPAKPECPQNTMSCPFIPLNGTGATYDGGDDSVCGGKIPSGAHTEYRHRQQQRRAIPHMFDADHNTTNIMLERLAAAVSSSSSSPTASSSSSRSNQPFFAAIGYQSPRLPWSYPINITSRYPPAENLSIATHGKAPAKNQSEWLEWFRPNEITQYSDMSYVNHNTPMNVTDQHRVRLAYYSAITHTDDEIGRLLDGVDALGLLQSTAIVFVADHGQNLGEHNEWSMMSCMETAARVPMMIAMPGALVGRDARKGSDHQRPTTSASPKSSTAGIPAVFDHPVELVDLMPTMISLAGLPPAPNWWGLDGVDLTPFLANNTAAKNASFTQVTRCNNCSEAYAHQECDVDGVADANWTVPCCFTPRTNFTWMGLSIRTLEWRYTVWCEWDGFSICPDIPSCSKPQSLTSRLTMGRSHRTATRSPSSELYDHRNDTSLYNVENFENENLAGDWQYKSEEELLYQALVEQFEQCQPPS